MLNFKQVHDLVARPMCAHFPKPKQAAVMLMRIGAHEHAISNESYLRQVSRSRSGYGPARGWLQFEPATVRAVTLWAAARSLSLSQKSAWLEFGNVSSPDVLMWDLRASAIYGRMNLYASPYHMPDTDDDDGAYNVYRKVWRPGALPSRSKFAAAFKRWSK